jgi:hypothetical protein
MRLNWKVLRLAALPALLLFVAGCGGFQASQSVSPATFLLPGLLKADPPRALPDLAPATPEHGTEVAQSQF